MTDRMIITRLRKVIADMAMGDTEYSETYKIPLEAVRDAQKYRAAAVLEVIADELEESEAIKAEKIAAAKGEL